MSPTKQKLLISGLIILGILIVAFFGVRAVHAFTHIRERGYGPGHPPPAPSQTDVELIRDWMTISYISKAYGVPDHMLYKELRIPDKGNGERSLKDLNAEYFPDQTGYVLETVKKAISDHRPPPRPTPNP